MVPSLALPAAFFLSGAAGLIFQVAWVYRCSLVLGSSVAAVTVVLSAFMGGLAAGNAAAAISSRLVAVSSRMPCSCASTRAKVTARFGIGIGPVFPQVDALRGEPRSQLDSVFISPHGAPS